MPKIIDLTGKTIKDLFIIQKAGKKRQETLWECQCSCGNKIFMTTAQINKGMNNYSCGCKSLRIKKKNILGQKFGKLLVIEEAPKNKDGSIMWKCQCDCGNITVVKGTALRTGDIASCGCVRVQKLIENNKKNLIDLTGKQFGLLTVIENTNKKDKKGQFFWKCQCYCGNICEVRGADLRSGNTKSCGCQRTKSFGEQKIKNILVDNNIKYNQEKIFDNCIFENNKYHARFDFYLPDYNTLIEYDGRQHFLVGEGNFDNPEKFRKTQAHDQYKTQWCKDNGYILIRIPYTHYDNLCLEDLLPKTSTFICS